MPARTATPPAQPGAGRAAAADPAALRGGIRTGKVVGLPVYNGARDSIGTADDIIVGLGGGTPVATIAVRGIRGIGGRYVAVPLSESRSARHDRRTLPRVAKECPRTLPPFSYGVTPKRG